MRIAVVTIGRVYKAYGGTEKVFFDMVNNFAMRGHEVTAITSDAHKGEPAFFVDPSVRWINCVVPSISKIIPGILRSFLFLCGNKRVRLENKLKLKHKNRATLFSQAIQSSKPDVVIAYQPVTTYILREIVSVKEPLITMFHFSPKLIIDNDEFEIYKRAINESSCVQVLMPEYVNFFKSVFPCAEIAYIPNVVPQYCDYPDYSSKKIINVARLSKSQKRQHLIIEAFALLKDRFPDWTVELWGEAEFPDYARELEDLIQRRGLSGRVKLCGPTQDVKAKLKQSSIFCFPSSWEGMPLAMTEAMSQGLPIVGCADCPSVNTIIRDGQNGFLCEDSPDSIASRLTVLMEDQSLRESFGKQAKQDMTNYAPELIWDQWETLIKKISLSGMEVGLL